MNGSPLPSQDYYYTINSDGDVKQTGGLGLYVN